MSRQLEFAGQSDPRQHFIDLGVPAHYVDMMRTILEGAAILKDTSKIIRSGKVNTALGGTQLPPPWLGFYTKMTQQLERLLK